ncbi:tetratricopeptide repeat protein 21B-like [Anneissia japonica]|uniref:tetratricopeptide repeat protein 21B-like n=1 Tax=Anneissia japonica TaxID=1529436 RepID=UPI0014258F02|nr:tetratricopeptide repeat protein 21B-like [Anneissia japonica]
MADSDSTTLAALNYYCQEKLYNHMQIVATEAIKKYGNDPVLLFYRAFSFVLEGRLSEGMRDLESLKDKADVNICSTMALMYAHKRMKTVDREAVQELDAKLKEERRSAGEKGLLFGGTFLWHSGRHDKAREYVDRMLKASPSAKEGLILKGWIDLTSGREAAVKKSGKYFDEVLKNSKELAAMLGRTRLLMMRCNFSGALDVVNQAVVSFPGSIPALIEKMRVQLAQGDWEQALDTANRALNQSTHCLEAVRIEVLYLLSKESNSEAAVSKLGELIEKLDRFEPKNPHAYFNMSLAFCRMCGRNPEVLQQTNTLLERTLSLEPSNAEFATEAAYELLLQNKTREAMKGYRHAMKLDETSVTALTGSELGEIIYLRAVLASKKNKPAEEVVSLLNEAVEVHFVKLKGIPLGPDYFAALNPDFLLELTTEYMKFAPTEPQASGQSVSPILKRCSMVLEPLTKALPGLLESLFLMGKVRFLSGQIDQAQSSLQHCLDQNPQYVEAHLLMAQIHMQQGNFQQSSQSLEMALSYRFEVREMPIYHLIKAKTLKKKGDYEECVKTLQAAMNLPGMRKRGGSASKRARQVKHPISSNDRVSVYLELVEAYRLTNATHEAAKIMQDAINEFSGTPEEIRITVANADLALKRGDVEHALTMLRNVKPEMSYYVEAREKMAEIYLHHRKDKRLYASCYRELVEKHPSPHTSLLLGDAYMSIQEPEKAIEVYEQALKRNPRDSSLASKIGQALVKTHQYGKAINYYEAALKSGGQSFMRHDLGELLLKLRQYTKGEKILTQALEHDPSSDLAVMVDDVKLLILLAKVQEKNNKLENALLALTKARDMQARVLKRVQVEQPDALPTHKQQASSICAQIAKHHSDQREYEKAIKLYKEALVYTENDGKAMLELARLYLLQEDLDACQHQLVQLLQSETENDAATVMMADLMFRKGEYDQATFHFQHLLERSPDHYEALEKLVDLLRRAGKLEDVPRYIEMAESSSAKATMEPGFNYCKALYEWHTGKANDALKHFNMARKDTDWGQKAIQNMIEICINPDNNTIGGETFETMADDVASAAEKADSEQMAARTADKLVRELKPQPGSDKHLMLENYVLMATKSKTNIEKALASFMEMATSERENIGALLGVATAYMMMKQTPRARNQLKRIVRMNWVAPDAEELCKSCCKAYEYMGFIMEKEQSYKDASVNYERAWNFSNKSSPTIGYKLAFNYMKARRYVDAIDICHQVLADNPNYPRMRKDILDKARASLRV